MYNNVVLTKKNVFNESVEKGQTEPVETDSLTREFLDTNKCYILDCGAEVFVWMGRNTPLDERKSASVAAEVILHPIFFNAEIIKCLQWYNFLIFFACWSCWSGVSPSCWTTKIPRCSCNWGVWDCDV